MSDRAEVLIEKNPPGVSNVEWAKAKVATIEDLRRAGVISDAEQLSLLNAVRKGLGLGPVPKNGDKK